MPIASKKFGASEGCMDALSHQSSSFLRDDPNIPGVVAILVFYLLIFLVGILASWVQKRRARQRGEIMEGMNKVEDLVLAGRDMGTIVGVLTMTDSFIFIKPMRDQKCRTLLDPIYRRFGRIQTLFVYLPHMASDVLWSASILTALGSSLSVIVGLNYLWSVVLSAAVVVIYTFVGGLYSVAYTDTIELVLLVTGLWLAVPFAIAHPATESIAHTAVGNSSWLGSPIEGPWIPCYIDVALLMICGGICWQPFFQRGLAIRSTFRARVVAAGSGFGCLLTMVPVFILGAVASSTDWNETDYISFGTVPVPECNYPLALPMVMRFLTPVPVAVIGLGAVSAAVMSSTDSAVLSSASLITLNLYSPIRSAIKNGHQAGDKELIWVMRIVIIAVGMSATIIALVFPKTYGLLVLSGDFQYVLIFPQLICAVYVPITNTYGSVAAFWVAFVLRILSGEPLVGLPTILIWPYADGDTQLFPFRTTIFFISLVVFVGVSVITNYCLRCSKSFRKLDSVTFQVLSNYAEVETNTENKHAKEEDTSM